MSTRQFQAYEDAAKAFEKAKEVLKYTRKEFTNHVRVTGTALRKAFVPDTDRTSLGSITTRTIDWCEDITPVGAMEVGIQSAAHHCITDLDCQRIKDWLMCNGWTVKETTRYNSEYHVLTCV